MWTPAARDSQLISETVPHAVARQLLLQARVNLELFLHASKQLHEALNTLNHHNFARTFGSGHMDEGIFGVDKHTAEMVAGQQRVTGFLLAVITAGHRFTRALVAARQYDRNSDWKHLRADLDTLQSSYHRVRNFMEHLHDAIADVASAPGLDCSFTPGALLTCKEPKGTYTFDFSEIALSQIERTYDRLLKMLKARKGTA